MTSGPGSSGTVRAYRDSLGFMPDGPWRRASLWLLDQPEYAPRWRRLIGLEESVHMTDLLLTGLPLRPDEVDVLVGHSTLMNVHQIHEVVSDNLAIGLAEPSAGHDARSDLLRRFNPAAVTCLRAMDPLPARKALPDWQTAADRISAPVHSKNEAEHRSLAEAYLKAHPEEDPRALEFSIAPSLLANIESGIALADAVGDLATREVFITGLTGRYDAVQRLVTDRPAALPELIATGTDSIMAISTLAYYTGLINEVVRPLPRYARTLRDGSLERFFTAAALLVRLGNDVGTRLLEQDGHDRRLLIARLRARAGREPDLTLSGLLWTAQAEEGVLLTRLKKDVRFGEFNICLNGIRGLPAASALALFEARLDHVTTLYRRTLTSLAKRADELQRRTGSPLAGAPALRFVAFHQELYRKTFDPQMG